MWSGHLLKLQKRMMIRLSKDLFVFGYILRYLKWTLLSLSSRTREKENEDLKKEIEELKATANENENKINEQASQLSEHDQKQKDLEDSLNAIDVDSLDKRIQALEDAKGQVWRNLIRNWSLSWI